MPGMLLERMALARLMTRLQIANNLQHVRSGNDADGLFFTGDKHAVYAVFDHGIRNLLHGVFFTDFQNGGSHDVLHGHQGFIS